MIGHSRADPRSVAAFGFSIGLADRGNARNPAARHYDGGDVTVGGGDHFDRRYRVARRVRRPGGGAGRGREMRASVRPVALPAKGRRESDRRHVGVPGRDTADGTVPFRGSGRQREGRGTRGQRNGAVGVLEADRLHREAVFARVAAHGVCRVVRWRGDRRVREPRQEGQRWRRRAHVGLHDDDYHAHVDRVRRTRSDGRQRLVDQHTGAHALGHGCGQEGRWPRPRQDHVRGDQRTQPVPAADQRLQTRERRRHTGRKYYRLKTIGKATEGVESHRTHYTP